MWCSKGSGGGLDSNQPRWEKKARIEGHSGLETGKMVVKEQRCELCFTELKITKSQGLSPKQPGKSHTGQIL